MSWPFLESLRSSAVIKLGGSLLDLPDIVQRLEQLADLWGPRPLLVVGGGEAADLVRSWDQRFQIGEQRSHWLALDSLELTARLLTTLWSRCTITRIDELAKTWRNGVIPIVSPREWFERAARESWPSPPQTWETTTDTIAAWIAARSQAEKLWLLKSVNPPDSLTQAVNEGLIDANFTQWQSTPFQWVNLRNHDVRFKLTLH